MNKNRWSSITLILFVLSFLGSIGSFMSYAEPTPLAYTLFIWPVLFGALTWKLHRDVKREREAADAAAQKAREAEEKTRQDMEAKRQAFRDRYVHVRFPVAGVTFQNPDKTDRQKILLELSFNQATENDLWLEEEDPDLGEDSGIRVLTDYGCVGYIRRSDKERVRTFYSKPICTKFLEVEQFQNDEGKAIYRADVVFVIDRQSPAQAWYFDAV